jgi:hypothetical protein
VVDIIDPFAHRRSYQPRAAREIDVRRIRGGELRHARFIVAAVILVAVR